jgi:putative MFS transporter
MGMDAYSLIFLLLMELTSSTHTSFAGNLALVTYTLGEVIIAIFAYVTRNWLNLKWLITGYMAVTLPYLYFVPESPYWLFNEKKYGELEVCLRKIATANGRSDSEWFPHYIQLIEDPRIALRSTKQVQRTNREKIMRFLPRLNISSLISFVTTLLYVKISYGLGATNKTISPYWNIIIGAAVESIGYVTASILITTRLGRKYALMIYALCTSICVLVIPFIMQSYPIVTTVISQMGKFAISGAMSVSWIYVPELFPTSMRGLANAIFRSVGHLGAILAPIVDATVDNKYMKITFYVYAALTLVMVGVISLLPETRNRSFHDEEEDDNDHIILVNHEISSSSVSINEGSTA